MAAVTDRQGPAQVGGRYWLTAKGYRALHVPVPDDIDDDERVLVQRQGEP